MGEPVTVMEKPSSRAGYTRFETNRSLTGMGHERYAAGEPIHGNRPPDVLARRLLDSGKAEEVHVYGQAVTVKLTRGKSSAGLKEIIETLYVHYLPGVEVPTPESFATDG